MDLGLVIALVFASIFMGAFAVIVMSESTDKRLQWCVDTIPRRLFVIATGLLWIAVGFFYLGGIAYIRTKNLVLYGKVEKQ